ncbi:MAG TPA: zf-HC2 domain-containing protein [Pyrinomonadaceae bacterium]|nr:zf-HC2 domain-containing protein [Pyrinomonadaceae bacterium]
MNRGCLDEAVLQAYIDGELSQAETGEAASHIAACAACAAALATAEGEAALFSSAFALDDSVTVPTEALRARISAAVAQLESAPETNQGRTRGWNFGGFFASLAGLFDFTPQRAAAFASILAVVAVALIYFAVNRQPSKPAVSKQDEIASNIKNTPPSTPTSVATNGNETNGGGTGEITNAGEVGNQSKKTAVAPVSYHRRHVGGSGVKTPIDKGPEAPKLLPGEKDYQTAIASLEKTIKLGGDAALRPAVRVEYERNLAILDNAIAQTRQVAAKDPKDKDAAGFLMSAYQSKVELLTKVADQAQVAALGR